MYAYQNIGWLLLLCIWFACQPTTACIKLYYDGTWHDWGHQVSVQTDRKLRRQILSIKALAWLYRVSHIEMSESKWFWGVEANILQGQDMRGSTSMVTAPPTLIAVFRPFLANFPPCRHLHKYLSQNWVSDGYFEVLNSIGSKVMTQNANIFFRTWLTHKM